MARTCRLQSRYVHVQPCPCITAEAHQLIQCDVSQKRQATEDEGGTPKSKKAKSASKKKGKAVEEEDEATRDDSEAGEVGEAAVKAEPVDEDMEDNSSDF